MKHMTLRLVGTVWLGLAAACDNPHGLPELCSARGDSEGKVSITCFTRFSDGAFDDIAAFTQTLGGTSGYVERWQHGESLHFTDFNGDGRVDLCGARGTGPGQLEKPPVSSRRAVAPCGARPTSTMASWAPPNGKATGPTART